MPSQLLERLLARCPLRRPDARCLLGLARRSLQDDPGKFAAVSLARAAALARGGRGGGRRRRARARRRRNTAKRNARE